jgi:hypothetical protein
VSTIILNASKRQPTIPVLRDKDTEHKKEGILEKNQEREREKKKGCTTHLTFRKAQKLTYNFQNQIIKYNRNRKIEKKLTILMMKYKIQLRDKPDIVNGLS